MITRFRHLVVSWWLVAFIALQLVLFALLPIFVAGSSPRASASGQTIGVWTCESTLASVGFKSYPWSNSTALVASALPEPAAYQIGNDFRLRRWDVWLYPPGVVYHFSWDSAVIEDTQPGGFPTGRIDPTGNPAPYYHDGYTKANFVAWGGDSGGPGALYRVRFPCHYSP